MSSSGDDTYRLEVLGWPAFTCSMVEWSCGRNVKTAPSTPEFESRSFPRHAESTSNLEMTVPTTTKKQHNDKSSDPQTGTKSPHKLFIDDFNMGKKFKKRKREVSPKLNKSRNEKFHKVFRNIPQSETVLNTYSCAYFGDILLQGYLYISPNWFCFYSKILGHAKVIVIPVSKVLNISREKTAFIIPNAIGIRTAEDKYVFGSLMSRDSTYKLLWSVWKQAKCESLGKVEQLDLDSPDSIPSVEYDAANSENNENNNVSKPKIELTPNTSYDTDDDDDDDDEEEEDLDDSEESGSASAVILDSRRDQSSTTTTTTEEKQQSPPAKATPETAISLTSYIDITQIKSSVSDLVTKTLKLSKSSLLLPICTVLSVLLIISAVILSYKILVLQARIDGATSLGGFPPHSFVNGDSLPLNVYYLNNQYHAATIEKFHSILRANIQILGQVHQSLKSLQSSPLVQGKDCPLPSLQGDTET